jgi:hypothetical protein
MRIESNDIRGSANTKSAPLGLSYPPPLNCRGIIPRRASFIVLACVQRELPIYYLSYR